MNLPTTPSISERIRTEIALAERVPARVAWAINMSSTTWQRRMDNPETWRIGELNAIASVLGIDRSKLIG